LILQSGIKRLVYIEKYKDTSGIDFLESAGLEVIQYG
jgi:dCMP deaminase